MLYIQHYQHCLPYLPPVLQQRRKRRVTMARMQRTFHR